MRSHRDIPPYSSKNRQNRDFCLTWVFFWEKKWKWGPKSWKIWKKIVFFIFLISFQRMFLKTFYVNFSTWKPPKVLWSLTWGVLEITSQRYCSMMPCQKLILLICVELLQDRSPAKRLKKLVRRNGSILQSLNTYAAMILPKLRLHTRILHGPVTRKFSES